MIFFPQSLRGCLLILIVISVSSALAQTFTPFYTDPFKRAVSVAWADYDLDGDSDLITSLQEGPNSTILYQNDNGDLHALPQTFGEFRGLVTWMDLENDGYPDLFLYDDTYLRLFKNNHGTFKPASLVSGIKMLKWGDYDGDGDMDVTGFIDYNFVCLYNDGLAFRKVVLLNLYQVDIYDYSLADYDGDHLLDLLVKKGTYYDTQPVVLYRNVNGVFKLSTTDAFASMYNVGLKSVDFDGDNDIDIIITGMVSGQSRQVFCRNDQGVFTTITTPFFESGYVYPVYIDPDKRYELGVSADSLLLYQVRQGGVYEKIHRSSVFYRFRFISSVSYSSEKVEGNPAWLAISGDDYFANSITHIYKYQQGDYRDLHTNPLDIISTGKAEWVDYDRDGLSDVFTKALTTYSPSPKLFHNTGGQLQLKHQLTNDAVSYGEYGEWMDFNKDGLIDLVARADNRDLMVYEGFTKDKITSRKLFRMSEYSVPKVIDFDRDGDDDIFVSDYLQGMYINVKGTYTLKIKFDDIYRNLGIADWADYDGDGDMDLAMFVEGGYTENVRLYKNTGITFQEVTGTGFPLTWEMATVKWMDFNQDGQLDLLLVGGTTETYNIPSKVDVRLYRNDHGTLIPEVSTAFSVLNGLNGLTSKVRVVDFDVDGYPDIVIAANSASTQVTPKLVLFRNNHGAFEELKNTGLPQAPFDATFDWGDFDGDGDPDLLLQSQGNHVQIYVNSISATRPLKIAGFLPENNNLLRQDNGYHLQIRFNKPVQANTGTIRFFNASDKSLVYSVNVSAGQVSVEGNIVKIDIEDNPFGNKNQYYILVSDGAISDLEGNLSSGVTSDATWRVQVANTKKEQQISFSSLPKTTVNAGSLQLTGNATSMLPVSYSSSNIDIARVEGDKVVLVNAGTVIITASQQGDNDYNAALPVTQVLTVTKDMQQITFSVLPSKTTGDAEFSLNAIATSGLDVAYSSSQPEVATISGKIVTIHGAGITTIEATQAGNDKYEPATGQRQVLKVDKQSQLISFSELEEKGVGDAPFTITAVSTSGLPVIFSSSDLKVATITGNIVTITGAGSTTLQAAQPGNNVFLAADPITRLFKVNVVTAVETEQEHGLSIYPNPVSETLNLRGPFTHEPVMIRLYNGLGNSLGTKTITGEQEMNIDARDLPGGIIILLVTQGDQQWSTKFSKR